MLLALSVIVSLFGIVNTLVLTMFERTRELGMLRAIGMTRMQVRTMIALESVVTALIGAVIGIGLGIVLSVLLIVRVGLPRALVAGLVADHLCARCDPRRGRRGDLPGAARRAAERASGPAVRVVALTEESAAGNLPPVDSLKGQLLLASPSLFDPNFRRTVVLVTEHNDEGAAGLVLNRRSETSVADALPDLTAPRRGHEVVYVGGPVQQEAVLCSPSSTTRMTQPCW